MSQTWWADKLWFPTATVTCHKLTARQVNIQFIGPDCATGWQLILCVRVSVCVYGDGNDANTALSPG